MATDFSAQLESIKNKEIKLEADLAIRDHPENVIAITQAALALFELDKAWRNMKAVAKPDQKIRERMTDLNQKIKYNRHKAESYESCLQDMIKEGGSLFSKYQKALDSISAAHDLFAKFYTGNKTAFDLMPLDEIFSIAGDAIADNDFIKK